MAERHKGSGDLPLPPPHLRHDRGWLWRAVGRTYLRCSGWRVEGGFPEVSKCVLIVAPHTSNWDFTLGIAVVFAMELRIFFLGKHTIFRFPFRRFLGWLGGIPVDRTSSHGVVGACTQAFEERTHMILGLSPEGTRRSGGQWKTGFYQIAAQAGVPIIPVGFDYRDHVVKIMSLFHPTGDLDRDLPLIQAAFKDIHGCRTPTLIKT